ncbi:MAG: hypothetical protein PHE70_01765 [Tepidanaerobacteraceae bacterium]|nr:hypothetical protein [Tepidanaerobacteraceae bacterium]
MYDDFIVQNMDYVRKLAYEGLIPKEEAAIIIKGLMEVNVEIENGILNFSSKLEEKQNSVEKCLMEKIGPLAVKLHKAC